GSRVPRPQAAGLGLAEASELCGDSPATVGSGSTIIAPKRVCTKSNLRTDAWALFGQANLSLGMFSDGLDTVTLKLGGRYSEETVESANPSIVIAGGGRGPVIRHTTASTYVERSSNACTPERGLSWEATPGVMRYYTYSEGFNVGSGENAAGSGTVVAPETVHNHEAGIKASLPGGLSANLA